MVENRAFVAGCDGQLHIVDVTNGQSLGQVDIQAPTGVTPAVVGDHVFFGTEGGLFFCVDWKLATVVWTFEDGQRQQPIRSAPAVTEGKVVFGGRSKKIYCLDASDGHRLWEFTTRQRVDAAPVIVKDRVIAAAGDGRLYSLDLADGEGVVAIRSRRGIYRLAGRGVRAARDCQRRRGGLLFWKQVSE